MIFFALFQNFEKFFVDYQRFTNRTKGVFTLKVEIIHPKVKADLKEGETLKDIFDTDSFPYCFENQGVSKEAYGHIDQQRIKKIEGKITSDDLEYEWTLEAVVGTLDLDPLTLTPTHSPPDTASITGTTGNLELKLKDDPNIKVTKNVVIFKDHLARDVANFQNGKSCSPKIEIADDVFLDVSLGCGASVVHAHYGYRKIGEVGLDIFGLWKQLRDEKGWLENQENINDESHPIMDPAPPAIFAVKRQGYTWDEFQQLTLKRGWKVWLGKKTYFTRHPSTVIQEGTGAGATAITYSADTVSGKFRHETVEAYYQMLDDKGAGIQKADRMIWILKPGN